MGDKQIHKKAHHHHKSMDITLKTFDNCSRTMDALTKSLDAINNTYYEQDKVVNFGVGYVEDKRITNGMSVGATNYGVKVYGGTDLLYNPTVQEYIHLTKYCEVHRYSWSGTKLQSASVPKRFTKMIYMKQTASVKDKPGGENRGEEVTKDSGKLKTGYYIAYNPGKSIYYILREDFSLLMDSVSVVPISKIIYGEQKAPDEIQFDFFIINAHTIYKYMFHPTNNVVSLQETIKASDIEADKAIIEHTCFDNPPLKSIASRKQWIYLTYNQHCMVMDVTGRVHGSKKNLHDHKITAICASGASEYIVTGDEHGLLKMWGQRWLLLTQIQPHTRVVSHIIEHPSGEAALSISKDLSIFAWSFSSKLKLESMKAPEIVEHVAINKAKRSFMVNGPRKLVLWKMDVIHDLHTRLSAPMTNMVLSFNPAYPIRAVVSSIDNSIRIVNPVSGNIITTVLCMQKDFPISNFTYIPQNELIYAIVQKDVCTSEVQVFDSSQNPAKLKYAWKDSMWNSAVTAIALYDYIPSIISAEIQMSFSLKKTAEFTGKATFIIGGCSDGGIVKLNMKSGEIEFYTPCHSSHVHQIVTNPELNQFVSSGTDPSVRLWKVAVNQDDVFIPLLEVSWNHPIKNIFCIRESIAFAISKSEISMHKVVIYNTLLSERFDHKTHLAHEKEIISLSGCESLNLFCSASKDETLRVWSSTNELVRLICLNWVPSFAGFATKQGDLFVGIESAIHLVPANKHLSVIYRNRVMMGGYNAGRKEYEIPLSTARAAQDGRMYFMFEEKEKVVDSDAESTDDEKDAVNVGGVKVKMPIPTVEVYKEPEDSQRSKDLERLKFLHEDLMLIVEGNHPIEKNVQDPRTMTKKQWDDYGKTIFKDDSDDRKFFVSESRLACMQNMKENEQDLNSLDAVQ